MAVEIRAAGLIRPLIEVFPNTEISSESFKRHLPNEMCVRASLSLSILSVCLSVSAAKFFSTCRDFGKLLQFCKDFIGLQLLVDFGFLQMCQFSVRLSFLSLFFFIFSLFFFPLSLSLSLSLHFFCPLSLSRSLSPKCNARSGQVGRARGTCDSANLRKSHLGLGLALFRRVFCVSLQWPLGILTYF